MSEPTKTTATPWANYENNSASPMSETLAMLEGSQRQRFEAACTAMQGLLANPSITNDIYEGPRVFWTSECSRIAESAVAQADALLAKLAEPMTFSESEESGVA